MEKKLAIKGHSTRSNEVIKLLEMLGGTNLFSNNGDVIGHKENNCYYISEDIAKGYISWNYIGPKEIDKYKIFTLEEFLEKYPFKVGDLVMDNIGLVGLICNVKWVENEQEIYYVVAFNNKQDTSLYTVNNLKKIGTPLKPKVQFKTDMELYLLPDGYQFIDENGNVINTTKIGLKKKSPKYPTIYEECEKILELEDSIIEGCLGYEYKLLNVFQKLLMCRDAYWKIAGEQMGLGKSWEPDWKHGKDKFYYICTTEGEIVLGEWYIDNKILAFPTEKMRDAFYENFKDLIESCKELL